MHNLSFFSEVSRIERLVHYQADRSLPLDGLLFKSDLSGLGAHFFSSVAWQQAIKVPWLVRVQGQSKHVLMEEETRPIGL